MTTLIYLAVLLAGNIQITKPPHDAVVLATLPWIGAGLVPAEVSVVKEEVFPGYWKCTAHYRHAIWTPFGPIPYGQGKVREIYFSTGARPGR